MQSLLIYVREFLCLEECPEALRALCRHSDASALRPRERSGSGGGSKGTEGGDMLRQFGDSALGEPRGEPCGEPLDEKPLGEPFGEPRGEPLDKALGEPLGESMLSSC